MIPEARLETELVVTVATTPTAFPPEVLPRHFTQPACRDVWGVMTQRHARGEPWDLVVLYGECTGLGQTLLARCEPVNLPVVPAMVPWYVRQLRERAWQRIVTDLTAELRAEGEHDPSVFASRLHTRMVEEQIAPPARTLRDAAKAYYAHLEQLTATGGLSGVTTGFQTLDDYFGGFQPGRLYVVAARPSMGKSALLLNFALNAAQAGEHVYLQCLEESWHAVTGRALARETGYDNAVIQRGQFPPETWRTIAAGVDRLGALPITLDDATLLAPETIVQRIKAAHRKFPLSLVGIDHLQEMPRTGDSRHLEMSAAMSWFKSVAKDLTIPVVVVSQLSRAVESAAENKPTLAHLKESGDIEAKADVVMLLYRRAYYDPAADPAHAELFVAKNRDGRVGTFALAWHGATMTFRELR